MSKSNLLAAFTLAFSFVLGGCAAETADTENTDSITQAEVAPSATTTVGLAPPDVSFEPVPGKPEGRLARENATDVGLDRLR